MNFFNRNYKTVQNRVFFNSCVERLPKTLYIFSIFFLNVVQNVKILIVNIERRYLFTTLFLVDLKNHDLNIGCFVEP